MTGVENIIKGFFAIRRNFSSLVVEYNVREPDPIAGNPDFLDAPEVGRVPGQVDVVPLLIQPDVRRQNLVLLILKDSKGTLVLTGAFSVCGPDKNLTVLPLKL